MAGEPDAAGAVRAGVVRCGHRRGAPRRGRGTPGRRALRHAGAGAGGDRDRGGADPVDDAGRRADSRPALPRDTIFAAVMIICNGVVGVCLLVGGLRHREQSFRIEGTDSRPGRAGGAGHACRWCCRASRPARRARATRRRSWSSWPWCRWSLWASLRVRPDGAPPRLLSARRWAPRTRNATPRRHPWPRSAELCAAAGVAASAWSAWPSCCRRRSSVSWLDRQARRPVVGVRHCHAGAAAGNLGGACARRAPTGCRRA